MMKILYIVIGGIIIGVTTSILRIYFHSANDFVMGGIVALLVFVLLFFMRRLG